MEFTQIMNMLLKVKNFKNINRFRQDSKYEMSDEEFEI